MRRIWLRAAALMGLASCQKHPVSIGGPDFTVEVITAPSVPNEVRLKLTNRSKDYICAPKRQIEAVKLFPASDDDSAGNQPPPQLLGGMDMREGLIVIPPNAAGDDYIHLPDRQGRVPQATSLEGLVIAVNCKELFASRSPAKTARPFKINFLSERGHSHP